MKLKKVNYLTEEKFTQLVNGEIEGKTYNPAQEQYLVFDVLYKQTIKFGGSSVDYYFYGYAYTNKSTALTYQDILDNDNREKYQVSIYSLTGDKMYVSVDSNSGSIIFDKFLSPELINEDFNIPASFVDTCEVTDIVAI